MKIKQLLKKCKFIYSLYVYYLSKKNDKLKFKKFMFLYKRIRQNFISEKGHLLMLMVCGWGNIGDLIIAEAEKKFFNDNFKNFIIDEIPTECLCKKSLKYLGHEKDKWKHIIITGGGFLGSLWKENENITKYVLKFFCDKHIVIFPQTFFYENGVMPKKMKRLYEKCNNIQICVRDKSYNWLNNTLKKKSDYIINLPDIALYLNYSVKNDNRKGILCCFRNDKEKVLSKEMINQIISDCKSINQTVTLSDTVFPLFINLNERKSFIEDKIKLFYRSELVITDRLHGVLLANICGTPCIFFDNLSHKISGVYDLWLKDNEHINFCTNYINKEIITEMLARGPFIYKPNIYKEYWEKLKQLFTE